MGNNKSILVIDDSPTVRKLAELVLSQEGYDVFTATDGDYGLQMARDKVPSMIIVDFIMPKMNGYQFCKNIRSDTILKDIPIILITSKGEDVGKGFDKKFGIVRYLQKPFDAETLVTIVNSTLASTERSSTRGVPEQQTAVQPEEISFVEITPSKYVRAEDNGTAVFKSDSKRSKEPSADYRLSVHHLPAGKTAAPVQDIDWKKPHPREVLPEESPTNISSENNDFHSKRTTGPDAPPAHPESAGPLETPASEPANDSIVHADLHEHIAKEFRHYFGRELSMLLKSTMVQALKETDLVRSSRRILSGELMYVPVSGVLQFISSSGISGKLSILTGSFNSEVYFENGQIAFASISRPSHGTCLEELLLQDGRCPQSELHSALSGSNGNCLTVGNTLVEKGLITRDELAMYYKRLSEEAVRHTLEAVSGNFYVEDLPLPSEIRGFCSGTLLNDFRCA